MTTFVRAAATLCLVVFLSACGAFTSGAGIPSLGGVSRVDAAPSVQRAAEAKLAIGPRYQWDHNYGYCGEVSFISAGLYYGQYISQYDARAVASKAPQNEARSQLLLGVNDMRAARAMRLRADAWTDPSRDAVDHFLTWIERNIALGHPVVIGVLTNEYKFYHKRNPLAGSPQYDHIVPVIGADSNRLTFSDNGLWGKNREEAPYVFTYAFTNFLRTRRQANEPNAPVYSLIDDRRNFGAAVSGVLDGDHETLRVRVTTNLNYESPQIAEGSSRRPAPERLVLRVEVSGLQTGKTYNLYRYDRLDAIPVLGFNAHASSASQHWQITGDPNGRYTLTQKIWSDETAAYRAVPTDAP